MQRLVALLKWLFVATNQRAREALQGKTQPCPSTDQLIRRASRDQLNTSVPVNQVRNGFGANHSRSSHLSSILQAFAGS